MVKRGAEVSTAEADEMITQPSKQAKVDTTPAPNNDLRIVLFPSTKISAKHPDWCGECSVDGQRYTIAVWQSVSKAGNTYLRGSLTKAIE